MVPELKSSRVLLALSFPGILYHALPPKRLGPYDWPMLFVCTFLCFALSCRGGKSSTAAINNARILRRQLWRGNGTHSLTEEFAAQPSSRRRRTPALCVLGQMYFATARLV